MVTLNALFLMLALVIQSVGQAEQATATGTVSGRLLLPSGAAASNVRIALSPADEPENLVGLTQTNNEGRYRIENVPPGRYVVTAGLINFPTYFPGVSVRTGGTVISVVAGSVVQAPEFRLAADAGFRVRGQIIAKGLPQDRPPQPLEIQFLRSATGGARGSIGTGGNTSPEVRVRAKVDPDGWFEFASLPAGRYSAAPFRGPLDPMPPVIGTLQNIDVDRDISDLRLDFPESLWMARLDGTVKIDGIGPVPSVSVSLTASPPAAPRGALLYKDTFYVSPVPSGEYSFNVANLPRMYAVKSIRAGSIDLTREKLKVTALNPPHIEVTLSLASPLPGVRVIGRMTNPENYRLPGQFQISGVTPGLTLGADILPDGTFELPLVPPGQYNVSFLNPIDSAERTVTVGNQNPTRLDVPMQISGLRKLWVRVVGSPVRSVWVVLRPTGQSGAAEIRATRNADPGNTSAAGPGDIHFEFLNVKPGAYDMVLVDQAGARGRGAATLNPRAVPIVVGDKDILDITLNAR